jgi:PleD family two-component response regulator
MAVPVSETTVGGMPVSGERAALEVESPNDPEQVSILLVDDQPENLTALEAILEPLGQRLVAAGSGREALRG